jgi:hypothetical protein
VASDRPDRRDAERIQHAGGELFLALIELLLLKY